jgi:hypothetical protein
MSDREIFVEAPAGFGSDGESGADVSKERVEVALVSEYRSSTSLQHRIPRQLNLLFVLIESSDVSIRRYRRLRGFVHRQAAPS